MKELKPSRYWIDILCVEVVGATLPVLGKTYDEAM